MAQWLIKSILLTSLLILEAFFPLVAKEAEIEPITNSTPVVIKTSVPEKCNVYRAEVEKYDWDVETAMRIMNAESGCDPTNHNYGDNHKDKKTGKTICLGSWNLFNVGCIHYKGEDISDWKKNIEIAYRVYKEGGWSKWTTYAKIK